MWSLSEEEAALLNARGDLEERGKNGRRLPANDKSRRRARNVDLGSEALTMLNQVSEKVARLLNHAACG